MLAYAHTHTHTYEHTHTHTHTTSVYILTLCVYVHNNSIYRDGSYSWNQTVWQTAGNIYYNTDFGDSSSFYIQLQICGDVSDVKFPACNVSSPVYLVSYSSFIMLAIEQLYEQHIIGYFY